MSAKLDMIAKRLKPKPTADDDLTAMIEAAVAKAIASHHDMPAAAPQSARVRSLLRQLSQPGIASERFKVPVPVPSPLPAGERSLAPHPGTAATAHKADAAIAPKPSMTDIPLDEVPIVISRDELGRIASVQVGEFTSVVTRRDELGRMLEWRHADGSVTRITRRDVNGRIAGMVTLPPPGKKIYMRRL